MRHFYLCYIASYSYYFYYGEYHSCRDGSQKVADDDDDDDSRSFVHIFPLRGNLKKNIKKAIVSSSMYTV